jgi:hypothetical protein
MYIPYVYMHDFLLGTSIFMSYEKKIKFSLQFSFDFIFVLNKINKMLSHSESLVISHRLKPFQTV